VPGLDFSNDPLLAGRIHSYVDTQISRLGGPNFHEIPINSPVAQVHNNQRDGMHRQAIPRGRVAYEPNSLGGGCPFQAGGAGFTSFPQPVEEDKVRGKPEKFAEHYNQATLFYESQSDVEKAHIAKAFRFELTKVQTVAVRTRVLAQLRNVSEDLAGIVADGLGLDLPDALPKALPKPVKPEIRGSASLSLLARPGEQGIMTRHIAILVADGVDGPSIEVLHKTLSDQGAVPRLVGVKLGAVRSATGAAMEVEVTLETAPSVLWDACVLPGGNAAVEALGNNGQTLEFIKDQYRHCKPILALGEGSELLAKAAIPPTLASGDADPGLLLFPNADVDGALEAFAGAIMQHRHFERETDPPRV
jgi:catalase